MSGWVIRPAAPADYAAIGELTVRVYESVGTVHPDYAVILRDVAARARHCELYVATVGAEIVGSVAFVPDTGPEASVARDGEAEFRTLAVDPAYGGRGIGRALVELCVDRARTLGRSAVVLSTMPWMTTAHRLYEDMGFRRTPGRDWQPRPGFDCYAYLLDL